jgi:hypothetical protein
MIDPSDATDALTSIPNIYEEHTLQRKQTILMVGALIALITPFTDTVYLPALVSVGEDLKASGECVLGTVIV